MKKNGQKEEEESKMTSGWIMFKSAFSILYDQAFHIKEGDKVPSSIELTDLDTATKMNLRDMCSSNVPLIINFGSCT